MMFGNFVKEFVLAWRDTKNKANWILYPRDPNQLEKEQPQYVLSHYRSAFLYCWESWGKSESKIPSAADIHQYMLKQSEKSPFRMVVIMQLRYAEISKLMKMSARIGKWGSVKLFLTAIRFALPLWATTHAVEYVRLGCDLLQFWTYASPAVRAL